jgi:hypothetical protein
MQKLGTIIALSLDNYVTIIALCKWNFTCYISAKIRWKLSMTLFTPFSPNTLTASEPCATSAYHSTSFSDKYHSIDVFNSAQKYHVFRQVQNTRPIFFFWRVQRGAIALPELIFIKQKTESLLQAGTEILLDREVWMENCFKRKSHKHKRVVFVLKLKRKAYLNTTDVNYRDLEHTKKKRLGIRNRVHFRFPSRRLLFYTDNY